jgi:aminoacrylate hydrolase
MPKIAVAGGEIHYEEAGRGEPLICVSGLGWSTGGAIGQTLAIDKPQRVARLVLCSTWTHCDSWFRRLFEARREVLRKGGSELYAAFFPLWVYPPDYVNGHDAAIAEEVRQAITGAPPSEVVTGRIDALLAFDRRAGLSRIRGPTLVVASENDYVIPSYHAEALARAIPRARLAMIPGGGHANTATRPAEFNRIVLEFLS